MPKNKYIARLVDVCEGSDTSQSVVGSCVVACTGEEVCNLGSHRREHNPWSEAEDRPCFPASSFCRDSIAGRARPPSVDNFGGYYRVFTFTSATFMSYPEDNCAQTRTIQCYSATRARRCNQSSFCWTRPRLQWHRAMQWAQGACSADCSSCIAAQAPTNLQDLPQCGLYR